VSQKFRDLLSKCDQSLDETRSGRIVIKQKVKCRIRSVAGLALEGLLFCVWPESFLSMFAIARTLGPAFSGDRP